MGSPSKVPTASPLQILAILSANAHGVGPTEIHRRTGHAMMTVRRWRQAWAHEASVLEALFRLNGIDPKGITFDDFYPPLEKRLPGATIYTSAEAGARTRFKTVLGPK